MASLLWTVFLVCLAAPWTEGAEKELGEDCTSSDACVHPTLETVCDQEKTCKIKQGQACSGDGYSTLCVAGAECTGNVCMCSGHYSNDSETGKCTTFKDKYAGACLSGNNCTDGDNLECVDNTVCLCNQTGGYNPHLENGNCTKLTNGKVGAACSNSSPCNTTENLLCGTASPQECVCGTGFTGPRGGDCVEIGPQLVGRTCTETSASKADNCGAEADTHLNCIGGASNDECACTFGYYGVTGGKCYPAKNTLNGGCSESNCTVSNSECTGTPKTCQCKAGFYENSGKCAAPTNSPTTTPTNTATTSSTPAPDNPNTAVAQQNTTTESTKPTNSPTATPTTTPTNTATTSSTPAPDNPNTPIPSNKVGSACTSSNAAAQCPSASNLECDTGNTKECVCKTGYIGPRNGDCIAIRADKVGSACTLSNAATQCPSGSNLECDTATTNECVCKTGYTGPRNGDCTAIPADRVGSACTAGNAATQCPSASNLECDTATTNECVCKTGYTGPRNSDCSEILARKVGKTCDPNNALTTCGDPATTYLECKTDAKACTCKDGFEGNAGEDCLVSAQRVGRTCDPLSSPQDDTVCGNPATTFLGCLTGTTECACKSGFTGSKGGACSEIPANKVGSACTSSNAATKCPSASHLECDTANTNTCVCKTGYIGPRNGNCTEIAAKKVGRACTPDSSSAADTICGAKDVTFLECKSSTTECACISGYMGSRGGDCTEIAAEKVGRACTPGSSSEDDDECGAPDTSHLECKTGTTECACKSGYTGSRGGTCSIIPEGKVGKTCSDASVCGDPATTFLECKTGACACKNGFDGNAGGNCVVSQQRVGRACNPESSPEASTACGPPASTHLECSTNYECRCKFGFSGSKGGTCSGASALVGSLVTLALAALLQIFMGH